MPQEFISIRAFAESMEAELARNCLESEGIQAFISSDSKDPGRPFSLVVKAVDAERARICLDGEASSGNSSEEKLNPAFEEMKQEDFDQAGREFEALRRSELEQKAAGVQGAARFGWAALIMAPVLFFVIANKQIAWRAVFACLFMAAIQFFVWKDARNAERELKEKNTPGK